MKYMAFIVTMVSAAIIFMPLSAQAEEFSVDQKAQIESILGTYIKENPEVIVEAFRNYQEKGRVAEEEKAKQSITDNLKNLTHKDLPSVGNPDAEITVVEFLDYNCGYCKRAVPDIQDVLKDNDNVRFVFQEMPILGPSSRTAAQYALAAHKQGKYFDYHVALMNHRGTKSAGELEKLAEAMGLDVEKMKKDASGAEINEALDKSVQLAQNIGIRGTPAFIIDGKLLRGYLGPDGLKKEIDKVRKE